MTKLTFLVIPFATGILVAQKPTFEVASVRINSSGDLSRSVRALPGGRLEATNAPLRNLVRYAYELRTLGEIEGGPNWMGFSGVRYPRDRDAGRFAATDAAGTAQRTVQARGAPGDA